MDQETLVGARANWFDSLREKGTRFLADLASAGLDILAAGLVQTETDGQWYYYLVSPVADTGHTRDGYALIQSVVRSAKVRWPRLMEIKLIGPSTPLGQGLVDISREDPDADGFPILYAGDRIGTVPIVGNAFIYTPLKPTPGTNG